MAGPMIVPAQSINHVEQVLDCMQPRLQSWPSKRRSKARWSLRWRPRWRVYRMTDAFPGQNFQSPARISSGAPGAGELSKICFNDKTHQAGPAVMLYKASCEAGGASSPHGFVLGPGNGLRSGAVYFRQAPPDELLSAKMSLPGSWLCFPPAAGDFFPEVRDLSNTMRVVVITSQDEFDETCYTDPGVDVSTSGNGRKLATHALLRSLLEESLKGSMLTVTAILVLDFQAHAGEGESILQCSSPLLDEGPQLYQVYVQRFGAVEVCRGDFEQLLVAGAGELEADVVLSTSVRRDMLTLMHSVKAKRFAAMSHDYNLPYGPWGVREAWSCHESHLRLLDRTLLLCTSRHLAEYFSRWSGGKVATRLCYCADYGYFDRFLGQDPSRGRFVTFISPCPAKGLCIFLRVARSLPTVRFLAVTTLWTKSIHEKALGELPNVTISPGRSAVEEIYERTAVLLVPSIWSEAFGLVAMEAQLRNIPVVSSDHYGLKEANMCEDLRVPNVQLVQDMRIRTLHHGKTIDELEETLPPMREEPRYTEDELMRNVAKTHLYVATPAEAAGFTERVQRLMNDKKWRREKGNEARQRAESFVERRRGSFPEFMTEIRRDLLGKYLTPWALRMVGFVDFLTVQVFFWVLMVAVADESVEAQKLHNLAQKAEESADLQSAQAKFGSATTAVDSAKIAAAQVAPDGSRICELLMRFNPKQLRQEFKQLYLERLHRAKSCFAEADKTPEMSTRSLSSTSRRLAERAHQRIQEESGSRRHVDMLLWRQEQVEANRQRLREERDAQQADECTFRPCLVTRRNRSLNGVHLYETTRNNACVLHPVTMASLAESLEAAYTGKGTGFLAQQDFWTREITEDGRVYYYNRATGGSQWHLPNHLYQSRFLEKGEEASLVFPGKARALLRVDCVTEAASASMFASAMASAGVPPEEILQANPLDVLDLLEQLLPPKLTRMLTTGDFIESSLADFQEVAGGKALPIEDAATMVCTMVNSLRIEPSLALSEERCLRLAQKYDVDSLGSVGPQEFLDLLRYVIVVRHSETLT
eukprot:symbB.v1.2.000234.t1/scaffold4.1/size633627/16